MWTIEVFTDSDWAGDSDSRKSVTGYIILVNGVPTVWKSKGQPVIALSSSEAEFYALGEAVKEVPFLVQLLLFMEVSIKLPVPVHVDNIGAIYMSEGNIQGGRTKHIDIKYKYVNSLQNDGLIKTQFVKSKENLADIATKNVSSDIMGYHLNKLVCIKFYQRGKEVQESKIE